MMRIGLDMDGVVADLVGGVTDTYKQWFGEAFVHTGGWDLHTGSRFETTAKLFTWLEAVPNFWRDLPPVPGAIGGIWDLIGQGHELVIVTNRPNWATTGTREWIDRWWPRTIPGPSSRPRPAYSPRVEFVRGDKSVIDCQIYVDDNPQRLREFQAAGKPLFFRFEQTWNKGAPGARARNWDDLVAQIRKVASATTHAQAEAVRPALLEDKEDIA